MTVSATFATPIVPSEGGASRPAHAGFHADAARATAGQNTRGARPIATHEPARASIGPRIMGPHSCARADAFVRAAPRNTTPHALMKHASARAPVIDRKSTRLNSSHLVR